MPLSNNILIKTLKVLFFRNTDKESFDEFIKIFPRQNFTLCGTKE